MLLILPLPPSTTPLSLLPLMVKLLKKILQLKNKLILKRHWKKVVCTHCLQFFLFLSLLNPLPWLSTPFRPWCSSCQDNRPPLCCSVHHPELRLVFIPWPCWTWLITISFPSHHRSHSMVRLLLSCWVILNIFPTLWILEGSRLSSWTYSFGLYLVVQWLSCVQLFVTS